jgi:hypothetical protein
MVAGISFVSIRVMPDVASLGTRADGIVSSDEMKKV